MQTHPGTTAVLCSRFILEPDVAKKTLKCKESQTLFKLIHSFIYGVYISAPFLKDKSTNAAFPLTKKKKKKIHCEPW